MKRRIDCVHAIVRTFVLCVSSSRCLPRGALALSTICECGISYYFIPIYFVFEEKMDSSVFEWRFTGGPIVVRFHPAGTYM